ncbi:hypothetical protein BYT27DRAFT_7248991 [Phlegmacium glaucopus]|nr:hypothetical protein BYT27DRAFT_7248991 [Phlegmacium glaucopus]
MDGYFPINHVKVDKYHIDILWRYPSRPIGPACIGIIGVAPSADLNLSSKRNDNSSNPEWKPSLFERVHGSAPDIAGKGMENPIGMIMGRTDDAIENILKEAKDAQLRGEDDLLTPDVNGKGTTEALGKAIENEILKTKRSERMLSE